MGHIEVLIAPTALYPAVFGLWEKTGREDRTFVMDNDLTEALSAYVGKSRTLIEAINSALADQLSDRRVAVWGAGNLSLKKL